MIEAGLLTLLKVDATLTGLVSGRVYPVLLPETPTYPAVTYQVISSVPDYTLDGSLGLSKTRIEVNAWGTGYLVCKQISEALRHVLDGYTGALADGTFVSMTAVVNSSDLFDSDARLYRVQTDYQFWHSV